MIGVAGDFQNALHVGLIRDLNTRVQCVLYFSFEQSTLGAGEMSDSTAGTTMVTSRSGTMATAGTTSTMLTMVDAKSGTMATAGTTSTMGTVSDPMAMAGTAPTMGTEVNSMFWNDGDGWDEPTISGNDALDAVVHVRFNDVHSF